MRKLYFQLVAVFALAILLASVGVAVTWSPSQASVIVNHVRRYTTHPLVRIVRLNRSKPAVVSYSYTVRPGDTLSKIAATQYGDANTWPSLWWINKRSIRNPNLIQVGERIKLSNWHPNYGWIRSYAVSSADPQPLRHSRSYSLDSDSNRGGSSTSYNTYQATSVSSYSSPSNYSGFQACVVARESGGNAQVMNSSGHYGLYQFSFSTWVAAGGSPADFGHASVAEQNRAFANAYRAWGTSPWAPYDGC